MKQTDLFEDSGGMLSGQVTLEDVFRAYYECRRTKRRTVNALAFELNFEQELIRLWQEINSGAYKIGRSIAFIVKYPVQREVFAADFRDRIVHHLVISKLNSLFEKEFIDDSYSCRSGKGTLFGVRSIQEKIAECSTGYTQDCYILKLDIRSFFMSIDKNILYRMLFEFISEKYHEPDKYVILRLVKQIVFYNPEDNCVIKGKRSDWNGLPYYKSLFWSSRHCGLPIGNLTSQIFANFYLNSLDRYVTEELQIEYYGRYVDDFVLIHRDKKVLLAARDKIRDFLQNRLKLSLHPQKFYLQHYSKGVRFIGAVIKPNRVYIGNRTKNNLYRKIYSLLPEMARGVQQTLDGLMHFSASVNSYLGFMRHYNTYNLRSKILKLLDNTFLGEISELRPRAEKFAVDKRFCPSGQKKRQLRRQRQYRRLQRYKK
ncbi:MAG: RNA-directed DNA polymerase [Alphaproteobacteria bacterium]|nr:RNA-directed DNA polymerase [Alphaproteobacteria bacterium]